VNQILQATLFDKFPDLLKKDQLLDRGIACGDGWYDIIYILCDCIMYPLHRLEADLEYCKSRMEEEQDEWSKTDKPSVWNEDRLREIQRQLDDARQELPVVLQVKEKLGGLRFYTRDGMAGSSERVQALVSFATTLANHTCEFCGAMSTAKIRNSQSWIRTLCDACEEKRTDGK